MFRVFVPLKKPMKVKNRWIGHMTYPSSGQCLYTRQQATDLLNKLYKASPWQEGDERECWAESETERFTIDLS